MRALRQAWHYDIKRSKRNLEPGLITGVRSICRYMQIGPNTFYKLHTGHDLPAMRLPDGRWSTSKNLIDGWIIARWKEQKTASDHGIVESKESPGTSMDSTEGCNGQYQETGGPESYEAGA